jgi:hypothetical protein
MGDEAGNTVACRVSHEALRDHANRINGIGEQGGPDINWSVPSKFVSRSDKARPYRLRAAMAVMISLSSDLSKTARLDF